MTAGGGHFRTQSPARRGLAASTPVGGAFVGSFFLVAARTRGWFAGTWRQRPARCCAPTLATTGRLETWTRPAKRALEPSRNRAAGEKPSGGAGAQRLAPELRGHCRDCARSPWLCGSAMPGSVTSGAFAASPGKGDGTRFGHAIDAQEHGDRRPCPRLPVGICHIRSPRSRQPSVTSRSAREARGDDHDAVPFITCAWAGTGLGRRVATPGNGVTCWTSPTADPDP